MIDISEIFYSIQGESTFAGLPCIFIRLSGCNLRCSYCDAQYTYMESPIVLSINDIIEKTAGFQCKLVEITGGEPLLQQGIYDLMDQLLSTGYTVLLESNGSQSFTEIPDNVHIISDIKCPSSNEGHSFLFENLEILKKRFSSGSASNQIKFVISDSIDFHWARELIFQFKIFEFADILLSPVLNRMAPGDLADLILANNVPARVQVQLHKVLWPLCDRGK